MIALASASVIEGSHKVAEYLATGSIGVQFSGKANPTFIARCAATEDWEGEDQCDGARRIVAS